MAFKNRIPRKSQASWHDYWQHLKVGGDVVNCDTDGLLPILTKYLDKRKKILEAGCGLGKWVIYLSDRGYQIEGIDNYREGIAAIKKHNSRLNVQTGDVEKLPYKNESIDYYLSFGVIEHWEEGPQKSLKEAYRVLKKGGLAIIETPYDNPLRQLTRGVYNLRKIVKWPARKAVELAGLRVNKDPSTTTFYEYHYTPGELASYISNAGFKILNVFPKDDTSSTRSIALWLDFPRLRRSASPDFYLTDFGRHVKALLSPFPWFWSCCIVVVAHKV